VSVKSLWSHFAPALTTRRSHARSMIPCAIPVVDTIPTLLRVGWLVFQLASGPARLVAVIPAVNDRGQDAERPSMRSGRRRQLCCRCARRYCSHFSGECPGTSYLMCTTGWLEPIGQPWPWRDSFGRSRLRRLCESFSTSCTVRRYFYPSLTLTSISGVVAVSGNAEG